MALLDLRLREFLDEVAAEGKTPGGGSVAALVTAMAELRRKRRAWVRVPLLSRRRTPTSTRPRFWRG